MYGFKYLCLVFSLIAFKALCDPVWIQNSFSTAPVLLITTEIIQKHPFITIQLLTGPKRTTNLLALGYKTDKNQTSELSVLNTTTLSIVRDYFDIGSLYSLQSVAVVSTPDFIFYTVVAEDDNNFSQISAFVLYLDAYFPDEFQLTNSTDKKVKFQVLQLIAHGKDPIAIFLETNQTNMTLYAAVISTDKKKFEKKISIVSGNITYVGCDSDFKSTKVFCICKLNQTVYSAIVFLKEDNNSPKIDSLFSDNKKVTHIPQKVVAAKDFYVYFIANQMEDRTELVAQTFDISADTISNSSTMTSLKNLTSSNSSPLRDAIPYGDGFAVFLDSLNGTEKQTWSYIIYNKDITVNGTEVTFANVSGGVAGFEIAKEFGTGAVNIAAYNFTTWQGASILNIYYGQIFENTPAIEMQ